MRCGEVVRARRTRDAAAPAGRRAALLCQCDQLCLGIGRRIGQHESRGRLGSALSAVEKRDRQRARRRAHRVGPARDLVVAGVRARDHDRPRLVVAQHVAQAGEPGDRQRQHRRAGADREEGQRGGLQRLGVQLVARGVADQHGAGTDGGRSEPARAHEPVGGPARGERPRSAGIAVLCGDLTQRGQQHVVDGALDRAQCQRGFHRAVGAIQLAARQRADEHRRVGRQLLPRTGNCRGNRQAFFQCVAQRGDLTVRVEAVLALGAHRRRIAETPLPGAQSVRAYVQERCSF